MISRRPNRRESSENAPGPIRIMAADIMITKTSDSLVSNQFKEGTGIYKADTAQSHRCVLLSRACLGSGRRHRSQLENAALQGDGHRLRAITSPQLLLDAPDVD